MSENITASHPDIDGGLGAYNDPYADFPPNLETPAQGTAFLLRLALAGAVAGILGLLVSFPLSWPLAIAVLLVWVLGVLAAGILASFSAKKHRAGIGYPADGEAWVRSFAFTLPAVAAVAGALTVIMAAATAIVVANGGASTNYTHAVLLAIVTVLAVAGLRWAGLNQTRWLVYGVR